MRARDTGAPAGTDTIALLMQLDFYWSISSGRGQSRLLWLRATWQIDRDGGHDWQHGPVVLRGVSIVIKRRAELAGINLAGPGSILRGSWCCQHFGEAMEA